MGWWHFVKSFLAKHGDRSRGGGHEKQVSLPKTKSSPLKIGHPKRKGSSSNHPFLGAFAVSFRECTLSLLGMSWDVSKACGFKYSFLFSPRPLGK